MRKWGWPPKEELHGQPLVRKKTDEHAARGMSGGRRAQPEAHARPVSTDSAGRRRDHRCGHLRAFWSRCALRWTGANAFLRTFWAGMRICGSLLRRVCGYDSAGGKRLYLCLRYPGRTLRLDYWLGPNTAIRHGPEHGFVGLVQPFHRVDQYFQD